jgi:hypothetical protein
VVITPDRRGIYEGESVTHEPTDGSEGYAWSTGETTRAIAVRPAQTTTYSVTVTSEFGCTGESETTVTAGSAIQVSITPSSPEVCLGDSVTLDAGPGFETDLWTTGETAPTITVQPD